MDTNILIGLIGCLVGWWFMGTAVCAMLDEKYYGGELLQWAKMIPGMPHWLGVVLVVIGFPFVLYLHWRVNRKKKLFDFIPMGGDQSLLFKGIRAADFDDAVDALEFELQMHDEYTVRNYGMDAGFVNVYLKKWLVDSLRVVERES